MKNVESLTLGDERGTVIVKLWGLYSAPRENIEAWMLQCVDVRIRRYVEVHEGYEGMGDADAIVKFANLPDLAQAIMCGEWGKP